MAGVDDELLNRVTWKIPNALALVGSRAGDEWNGMTASWITQLSMEPVLIGIGVDNSAVTHRLITAGGSFTVNLWSADGHQGVRQVLQAGGVRRRGDDAQRPGPCRPARRARRSSTRRIAYLDCEVRAAHDLGTHTLFIGEVVDAGVTDDEARAASMSDTRMKYGGVKRH